MYYVISRDENLYLGADQVGSFSLNCKLENAVKFYDFISAAMFLKMLSYLLKEKLKTTAIFEIKTQNMVIF